jgi:FkbM family methyltransferase
VDSTVTLSSVPRLLRFAWQLPEIVVNCAHFRVGFVLPRWFRTPHQVFVGGQWVPLSVPEGDRTESAFVDCFVRNDYGLGKGLGSPKTILDIGAHVGFFSLAARSRYPAATIHAYEPNPRALPCLRSNTTTARVEVFAEAVGGEAGRVAIIDDGPSDEARARLVAGDAEGVKQVRLETAVERIGGEVDLLKLDCEGAEFEILQPGPVWQQVRQIRMEYHFYAGGALPALIAVLNELGYMIDKLQPYHAQAGILWATRKA